MEVTEMIISSLSLSIFQVRCIDNSVSYNALQCLKGWLRLAYLTL